MGKRKREGVKRKEDLMVGGVERLEEKGMGGSCVNEMGEVVGVSG